MEILQTVNDLKCTLIFNRCRWISRLCRIRIGCYFRRPYARTMIKWIFGDWEEIGVFCCFGSRQRNWDWQPLRRTLVLKKLSEPGIFYRIRWFGMG